MASNALRQVTKGRWGEIMFIGMSLTGVTMREMDKTVKSWDLLNRHQEQKRKHGAQQVVRNVEEIATN